TVLLPFIGIRSDPVFSIGPDYTGLMDEFRLTPYFVSEPLLQRLPAEGGEVVIGPIDLEEMGSQVLSIDVDFTAPKGSSVFSYYRVADNMYDFALEEPDWNAFTPGEDLDPPPAGSYLEIKCELFPDGSGMEGPAVSSIKVNYRPNLPPPAPVGLTALPRDGAVHLNWGEINQRDLGGYLVYYGTSPGVYRGDDAGEGVSPIDVGTGTELRLTSLKNGQLYYFAVAAYDTAGPSHRSSLSRELSARPSAYYGE
ncbi:MAG: fibronectin type III domain-containing protein, partial [Spirochaetota bacterium]|nr:fibronectin type III domain-containing protein [Spirochaetota bacterium]